MLPYPDLSTLVKEKNIRFRGILGALHMDISPIAHTSHGIIAHSERVHRDIKMTAQHGY